MYKLRAHKGVLWSALFVLITGSLLTAYFYREDAYMGENARWLFTLIATVVIDLLLVIAATAHFWFRHLWHHRPGYKRG